MMAARTLMIYLIINSAAAGLLINACEVRVQTDAGAVCGLSKSFDNNTYALFRNVPYAKQPLGELRFKELQPVEPWEGDYDATVQGPICYQKDRIFLEMMQEANMSEACIHANVYTPIDAVCNGSESTGLPILVFIHGGGFQSGSGGEDIYGPEYFFGEGVVVITFNYRINVFGFLSLNSTSIPGNQALRDAVTLLRWVQKNARAFGGNPDNVTLMGQSTGACNAHLLSLSPAAEGLFHKIVLLSGTSIPGFYTPSPAYASTVASMLLLQLGINSTDPEEVHNQLIELPIETLMDAYYVVQDATGLVAFTAVEESTFEGVTQIVDGDPDELVKSGRGSNIPMVIGFDTSECFFFEPRFTELNMLDQIKANHSLILSPKLLYTLPNETALEYANKVIDRYSGDNLTLDSVLNICTDTFIVYPSMKLAQWRAENGGETYMYQFSYVAEYNRMANALGLEYNGTTHVEDLTYIFRANHLFDLDETTVPEKDELMRLWMSNFIANFTQCSNPTCSEVTETSEWPPVSNESLQYLNIEEPKLYNYTAISQEHSKMIELFDSIQN